MKFDYETLNRLVSQRVKNYIKKRRYVLYYYDEEDIKQELFLFLLQKIKYIPDDKPQEEQLKIINKLISFRLINFGREIRREAERFINLNYLIDMQDENTQDFNLNLIKSTEPIPNIFFESIKSALLSREYLIIKSRFIDNLTFREIGEILNISKQRVYEIYKRALKKIKKVVDKTRLNGLNKVETKKGGV